MMDSSSRVFGVAAALVAAASLYLYEAPNAGQGAPTQSPGGGEPTAEADVERLAQPKAGERVALPQVAPTTAAPVTAPELEDSDFASVRVLTDWGGQPGSASSVELTIDSGERILREVRSHEALFEGLPSNARAQLTWWSGRPGLKRGELAHTEILLPERGQLNLTLEATSGSTRVGHVHLTVLLPAEYEALVPDLVLSHRERPEFRTSLRSAPWDSPAVGERRAPLWRLQAGLWAVELPGVGVVAELSVEAGRWAPQVVDLQSLSQVRLHVLNAQSDSRLPGALAHLKAPGSESWLTAKKAPAGAGETHRVWLPPGQFTVEAEDVGMRVGSKEIEVLEGGGDFLISLEPEVVLQHRFHLGTLGEQHPMPLSDWTSGSFQTLRGDGVVETLAFTHDAESPMAYEATVTVSAPGRYRWLLPERFKTYDRFVEFEIAAGEMQTSALELAP